MDSNTLVTFTLAYKVRASSLRLFNEHRISQVKRLITTVQIQHHLYSLLSLNYCLRHRTKRYGMVLLIAVMIRAVLFDQKCRSLHVKKNILMPCCVFVNYKTKNKKNDS